MSDMYFCGHCPREQFPYQGEKCISCGRTTIIWDTNRYSRDWAMQQWKNMRQYYGQ